MSRLYDEWKRAMGNKLPTIIKDDKIDATRPKAQPLCISIPLEGGSEPKEINEQFLKAIEREYAVRYLEQIGVDPTKKEIEQVLREFPLSNCVIKAGWLNSTSWLADAIHIYPRVKHAVSAAVQPAVSKENLGSEEKAESKQADAGQTKEPEQPKIDLNIDLLKQRFMFPFLKQHEQPTAASSGADLLESKLFKFPFEDVTVATQHIKELMQKIALEREEVASLVQYTIDKFPYSAVRPKTPKTPKKPETKSEIARLNSRPVGPKKLDAKSEIARLNSEEFTDLVILTTNFCYWTVFGHLNKPQPPSSKFSDMFLRILRVFAKLEQHKKQRRVLYVSFALLFVRILVDHFFKTTYKQFFSVPAHHKLASAKIQSVITRLIDPEEYYSRFSPIESKPDAIGIAPKCREPMSGKYYSTSSTINSLYPHPAHPRTRMLMAKQETYKGKLDSLVKTGAVLEGSMRQQPGKLSYYQQIEPWRRTEYLNPSARNELLSLAKQKVRKPKSVL